MSYMAKWGPKGFIVSDRKIAVLQGLTTSLSLKTDSENDTSGTQPTNTRGRELRPINFSVAYMAAAGVDPRGQLEEWESLLGESYPLVIGGRRFGAEKMMLTKVEASDIVLSNSGKFISVTVAISLEEYSEGKTSKLTKKKTEQQTEKSTESSAQAAAVYTATVEEKREALNATATAKDRETAAKKYGSRGAR